MIKDRETIIENLQYMISGNCTETQFDYTDDVEAAIALLKDQPQIVRCEDCKKCDLPEEKPYENGYCSRCGYVKMDWFCADGDRREGG